MHRDVSSSDGRNRRTMFKTISIPTHQGHAAQRMLMCRKGIIVPNNSPVELLRLCAGRRDGIFNVWSSRVSKMRISGQVF
jgi:hypothetical protein